MPDHVFRMPGQRFGSRVTIRARCAAVLIEELLLHHPVLRFANSKDRSWRTRQSRRGGSHSHS
jgi:hypothetical protein